MGGEPVIKINGGNNHCHPAKRRLVVEGKKELTCGIATGSNFCLDMKR
jgi:hypothetical protein